MVSPQYPIGEPHVVFWARTTGPNLGPFGRHILATLSYHANAEGWCSPAPSQDTIAFEANCRRQAAGRMLQILAGLGLIEMYKVPIENGRYRYDYRYTGYRTEWQPAPLDPDQEPNTDAAFAAVVQALRVENEQLKERLAAMPKALTLPTGP